MRRILSFLAIALAAAICISTAAVYGEGELTREIEPEINTEYRTDLYPYVVHGEAAAWYIAKADIDEFGLDYMCSGLSRMMEDLEQDFADARNALSAYLADEVPVIRICTDFCNHAERSRDAAAYFNGRGNFIKVFYNWTSAGASLLHEYVHYLTFRCAKTTIRFGFWSEGIAEYVSGFLCRNRIFRSASREMPEDVAREARDRKVCDPEDGTVDERLAFLATAEMFSRGAAIGKTYSAVSNETIERTEKIQQNPEPNQLSYQEAACMVAYLAETYGQDEVFSHWDCDPEQMQEVFGLSFPELYRAWTAWNTRQCEQEGLVTD